MQQVAFAVDLQHLHQTGMQLCMYVHTCARKRNAQNKNKTKNKQMYITMLTWTKKMWTTKFTKSKMTLRSIAMCKLLSGKTDKEGR